jgi:hypothetical protein
VIPESTMRRAQNEQNTKSIKTSFLQPRRSGTGIIPKQRLLGFFGEKNQTPQNKVYSRNKELSTIFSVTPSNNSLFSIRYAIFLKVIL